MGWFTRRKKVAESRIPQGTTTRTRLYNGDTDCFKNSAFWSCITLLCSKYATLPFTPHEEGSYKAMGSSRLLYRLLENPNPYMRHYDFMYVMGLNYELYGQAIAVLEKKNGLVIGMYPVSPTSVTSTWNDGNVTYTVYGENGTAIYKRDDLLIINNTPAGYTSVLSPLANSREGLMLAEKAKNMQAEYYDGGSVLGRVIKVQDRVYAEQREQIKEMMDSMNGFRNLILPQSVEIESLKTEGENLAKLIEAQSWDVLEVSRRFHVPKSYLGDTSGGYGNAEQQSIQLVQECLYPRCKCWEMAFNADVCQENEYVKFELQSLMRGDHSTRQSWYQTMLTHGVYSINEVRALEDMEPIGKEGDNHYFQSGFTTVKNIGEEPQAENIRALDITALASSYGINDKSWVEAYNKGLQRRGYSLDEEYRAKNACIVKKAQIDGRKYKANGIYPDENGYFVVEGKKFRNPPFYSGDKTVIEVE